MNILTGIKTANLKVTKEVLKLSDSVRDTSLSLIDRVESFEDIMSLEVGDTSLTRARALEREYDIHQLYIKYEGENPSGTQKDRIAFAQVLDALRRGYSKIVVATCGNYGVAVAYAAFLAGIECEIFIPKNYHTDRISEMENFNARIMRLEGTYEDNVYASSKIALDNQLYDANPGGANTPLQIAVYSEIAYEIYDDLRDAPKYLACPVSNGTLIAGVYRGFEKLFKRGKTSRIPVMVAASSTKKNPIVTSFLAGLDYCKDLDTNRIKETKINEPLINWHSFDGDEAIYAIRNTGGYAFHINDQKMKEMSTILNMKEGMRVLPASTAGLIALLKLNEEKEFANDRYIAIITGKY
ncbi:pyridoxal-phosphate dependent enzyme [Bacteroidota bacterium]